ncbi:MAG: InlB B-repeat-containing protein, partial [Mobilitalea sp.]
VPVDSKEYEEGDTATLADGKGLSKKGYEFVGWSLNSNGEAIAFNEVLVNEDVTFYAVWEAVDLPEVIEEDSIPKTGNSSGIFLGSLMLLFGGAVVGIHQLRRRKNCKKLI